MAGGKTDEEYRTTMAEYNEELRLADMEEQDQAPKDLSVLKGFLDTGLNRELYDSLTRAEKRLLWRSLINEIHFEADGSSIGYIDFKHN